MRHRKIKKMLSDFIDDRLSLQHSEFIKDHLSSCADCRALLTSFQQLHSMSTEPIYKVNPFFAQRVLATLKSRTREGFWQVFNLIPRPVIVTGLVVSLVTLFLVSIPGHQTTNDYYVSEFSILYGDQSDSSPVTDDQALAIAINAESTLSTRE
ncbi:zf-HC2 domain-containing protein [candidate division KSB1 bacterium]|nr:zf-HC2 domain-containing protein [candidate division KSB1 bacterium]